MQMKRWPQKPWLLPLLTLVLAVGACQPALLTPPRLASATAQRPLAPTVNPTPLFVPAPTATPASEAERATPMPDRPNPRLTVWVNETSPAHEAALQQMMEPFGRDHQISVELVSVPSALLPELLETAVLSDTLPDIVLHPIEYTVGWAERGILDPAQANAIIDSLGRDSFDAAALDLVNVDGLTAAIPSDGYKQLLVYRQDWAAEKGLPRIDSYEAMMTAAEAFHEPDNLIAGIVMPTESNLIATHQAFEQLAAANGCQLIDDSGKVRLLDAACNEALDFYYAIVHQFSPVGVQTDISTRNAYLSGRAGVIISSPSILPILAGLSEEFRPDCPDCLGSGGRDYLARNSMVITEIQGFTDTSASFGEVTYLGVTRAADPQTAAAFAAYWFNDGYLTWLSVEPERKVPMRLGTRSDPRRFLDAWKTLPLVPDGASLAEIYGPDLVERLSTGIAASNRWGFRQGQGALMSAVYEKLTFSVTLQEMLSGYFTSEQTLLEAYTRVIDLIPGYTADSAEG
ncbi:MAG: ABC transporter substrate-binding protein [Anaerolineae bacterium]